MDVQVSEPLPYCGAWLDRASARRGDPGWVADRLTTARLVPMWRDRCLVAGDPPRPVATPGGRAALLDAAGPPVFLGVDGEQAVFAVDLSDLSESDAVAVAGASAVLDVRALAGTLPADEAAVLAYARGILHWSRHHRFCGRCGAATRPTHGGHQRQCPNDDCGHLLFPRIEPAVIMLVEAPGTPERCLLARHRGAAPGRYATLAGFVEIGESLEDAVRREAAEEAGVRLGEVRYQASQAWPFPAGLMVGFRAVAVDDTLRVDGDELAEARWFTRAELGAWLAGSGGLRRDSIEASLIESWLYQR
ncbi:MAG TPA: NAD(+) diphosphatase [Micromonosporaceae bacterium]